LAGKRLIDLPIADIHPENLGGVGKGRFVNPELPVANGGFRRVTHAEHALG
jgi:hypothetical protein